MHRPSQSASRSPSSAAGPAPDQSPVQGLRVSRSRFSRSRFSWWWSRSRAAGSPPDPWVNGGQAGSARRSARAGRAAYPTTEPAARRVGPPTGTRAPRSSPANHGSVATQTTVSRSTGNPVSTRSCTALANSPSVSWSGASGIGSSSYCQPSESAIRRNAVYPILRHSRACDGAVLGHRASCMAAASSTGKLRDDPRRPRVGRAEEQQRGVRGVRLRHFGRPLFPARVEVGERVDVPTS